MTQVLNPTSLTPVPDGTTGRTRTASTGSGSVSIRWIESVESLESIKPQWDELAENAIHRNASLESNFLIPAFKHLNDGKVRILVAEESPSSSAKAKPMLLGLMPVVKNKFYHLPIPCLKVWMHEQGFDSTPLLASTFAEQTFNAMLDFLSAQKIGLLSLDTISAEPEFQTVLDQVIGQRNRTVFIRDSFSRAAVRPASNFDDYYSQFASKNVKKNFSRLKRRLAELGELTYELADDFSDFRELTERFLELEASGWKVETGTALSCHESTKNFYEELISRSAQAGKARFVTMKLDGKPIAMLSDIRSGRKISSFKTAFDESYAAFSPGLQIEMKNIEYVHQTGVALVDSCTDRDNANINRIFGQRLQFQSIVIGLRPGIPGIATRLMPWIQSTAKRLKRFKSRA